MATIRDVATEARVSISTVSHVINGTAPISLETSLRVQAAIKKFNYIPSNAARTMRVKRAALIGLLISDIQNPFFTALVRGVEDVAQAKGYSVILCNSDENLRKEQEYVAVMCAEKVAGAIVVPASEQSKSFSSFAKAGIPFVTVDRNLESATVDTVLVDNIQGSYQAIMHLLEGGYRKIGVITGPLGTTTGRDRLAGYRMALKDKGVPGDSALEKIGTFKFESATKLTAELLDIRPSIDALFIANSVMALGALQTIEERNLRIPSDIAVICFDEMSWARLPGVSLTTVKQPTYEIGSVAALRLFDQIQTTQQMARQKITLMPELVVRNSSKPKVTGENSPKDEKETDVDLTVPFGSA